MTYWTLRDCKWDDLGNWDDTQILKDNCNLKQRRKETLQQITQQLNKKQQGTTPLRIIELHGGTIIEPTHTEPNPQTHPQQYYYNSTTNTLYKKKTTTTKQNQKQTHWQQTQ